MRRSQEEEEEEEEANATEKASADTCPDVSSEWWIQARNVGQTCHHNSHIPQKRLKHHTQRLGSRE
jgi:hypothetical protein